MTSPTRDQPVNQLMRINILRIAFVSSLPLLFLTHSTWGYEAQQFLRLLGLAAVITAVLGRFWAILYIGGHKNRTVMQDGPYSICRHPLYLFSTIGAIGLGLLLGSLVLAVVLGLLVFMILSLTARKEEAFLRHQFGPDYDAYAARVPMILPRLSGFRTEPRITVSVPHLRQNLMDGLVFLLLIPFAEVMRHLAPLWAYPIW